MEFGHMTEALQKTCVYKYKEIIAETLAENNRKGSFVRIYPAKGSDAYDTFFQGPRPLNKLLYKVLYNDEVIHIPKHMSHVGPASNTVAPPMQA
jgi:hypothetical protein